MCMAAPDRSMIKELRHELGLSRSELAVEVGCSYQQIANIENGHGQASEDFLAKLARYFTQQLGRRIRLTDLVGAKDDPKPKPEPTRERRSPTSHPEPERPYPPPNPPGPRRDQAVSA